MPPFHDALLRQKEEQRKREEEEEAAEALKARTLLDEADALREERKTMDVKQLRLNAQVICRLDWVFAIDIILL